MVTISFTKLKVPDTFRSPMLPMGQLTQTNSKPDVTLDRRKFSWPLVIILHV